MKYLDEETGKVDLAIEVKRQKIALLCESREDYDQRDDDGKKVSHVLKDAKALIFLRFHQCDVVDALLTDAATRGVGCRYLVQHLRDRGRGTPSRGSSISSSALRRRRSTRA